MSSSVQSAGSGPKTNENPNRMITSFHPLRNTMTSGGSSWRAASRSVPPPGHALPAPPLVHHVERQSVVVTDPHELRCDRVIVPLPIPTTRNPPLRPERHLGTAVARRPERATDAADGVEVAGPHVSVPARLSPLVLLELILPTARRGTRATSCRSWRTQARKVAIRNVASCPVGRVLSAAVRLPEALIDTVRWTAPSARGPGTLCTAPRG